MFCRKKNREKNKIGINFKMKMQKFTLSFSLIHEASKCERRRRNLSWKTLSVYASWNSNINKNVKRGMFLLHYIFTLFPHTHYASLYIMFLCFSNPIFNTHNVLIILFKYILSTSDWTSCELYRCSRIS